MQTGSDTVVSRASAGRPNLVFDLRRMATRPNLRPRVDSALRACSLRPLDRGIHSDFAVANGSISRPASGSLDEISSHPGFVYVRALLCSSCAIASRGV